MRFPGQTTTTPTYPQMDSAGHVRGFAPGIIFIWVRQIPERGWGFLSCLLRPRLFDFIRTLKKGWYMSKAYVERRALRGQRMARFHTV